MGTSKKTLATAEIRGTWRHRLGGHVIGKVVKGLVSSLDYTIDNASGLDLTKAPPIIYAFWHEHLLAALWLQLNAIAGRKNTVLTSASKDGSAMAAATKVFGLNSVRGSSSRGGAAALIAVRNAVLNGSDVTFTPDGPRGPRHSMQPGLVKLASITGAPIVPIVFEFSSFWRVKKSWDQLIIPKPMSAVRIQHLPAISVPSRLDEEAFHHYLDLVKTQLELDAGQKFD